MIGAALAAGAILGVLSRVEEVTPGLSAGVSSDSAWVATAFVVGSRAPESRLAALLATATMCAANGAYYVWIALAERGTPLAVVAGDPWTWVLAGVLTGLVFGVAGRLWRVSAPRGRLAAVVPLATVFAIEAGDALRGGAATEAIGLAIACVLPVVSSPTSRWPAVGVSAALAVLAASGVGAELLP